MNTTLYKNGIKGSWKLWLVLLAVMSMYISIVVSMFDPDLGSILEEFSTSMPELMSLFAMQDTGDTLVEFMASYLYGMIFLIFPMLYSIITANRLIAKHVDRGSMAYLLAAPVSRVKVAFTQLLVLLTGVVLLVVASASIGAIVAHVLFPGELELSAYVKLNGGVLLLHLLITGICFLASCLFNETKWSVALGAGFPTLSFMIQMVANLGGTYENAKYASFFSLFSPTAVIHGENWVFVAMIVLILTSLLLYIISLIIFNRKDIPV